MSARATHALIARAARMIQRNADCLRECHAPRGDWGAERETQQIYDEEVRTANGLRSLLAPAPAKTPPEIPEGDVLIHLARVVGLRDVMQCIDAKGAKDLLWKFLAAAIAVMDETGVVDAEFVLQAINYADDLAVAEHIHSDNGARHALT
ncbi:hypothetical protein [Paraburkholderia dipogonis]|uniref:hypothetical protein n=1 Tax=Paraburkholderia dipogonis TaxID=1211383 RepID=UPI0038BAC562